jgi:hypothetical protein
MMSKLYDAWIAAESAFETALQEEYRSQADAMRKYPHMLTPAIRKLHDACCNCGQAWNTERRLLPAR